MEGGRIVSTVDPTLATEKVRLELLTDPGWQMIRQHDGVHTAAEELDLRASIMARETGIPYATAYTKVFDSDANLRKRYARQQQQRFDVASAEEETMQVIHDQVKDEREGWERELDDLAMAFELKHDLEEGTGRAHILRQRGDLAAKWMDKLAAPPSDGTALTELNREAALRASLTGETFEQAFVAVLDSNHALRARYARER